MNLFDGVELQGGLGDSGCVCGVQLADLGFDGAEAWYDYAMGPTWQPTPLVCEAIAADLALLGAVTGRPQTPPGSLARLAAWRSARAREAPRRAVGLCVTGGLPEVDARAALEAALLRQTARVGACAEAGWRLELTVSLAPRQDPQLPEVWFCDATLDGALRDPAGQTAAAVAARGGRATKSAGRTAADACREAIAKAATELGEGLTLP